MLTDRPCQNEERVRIRFALPISGRIVTLDAVARWVRQARGTGAVGLELVAPPENARLEIAQYVSAMGGEL